MSRLTEKQKKLFQTEKHILVDMIIQKDNELDLCHEANITAQEELDGKIKPKTMDSEQNINLVEALNKSIGLDGLNHILQEKIDKIESLLDKVWEGRISDKDFRLEVTSLVCSGGIKGAIKETNDK
tara:strand:+ start:118 stop:495 length:378 start_codon:yes stop_codon:yes gene_type:complete